MENPFVYWYGIQIKIFFLIPGLNYKTIYFMFHRVW